MKKKSLTGFSLIAVFATALSACPDDGTVNKGKVDDGKDEKPVAVTVAVSGVSLAPAELSLALGSSFTLAVTVEPEDAGNKDVSWSSSDPATVSVANGRVSGLKVGGPVTITVTTADGGKSAECAVTVTPVPVSDVILDRNSATLVIGAVPGSGEDTLTLTASVYPDNVEDKTVTWSSNAGNVAAVADGVVTALGKGTAVITAVSNADNTKTAECVITVTEAVEITSLAQLQAIAGTLTDPVIEGYFYLTANIDAGGIEWESLGDLAGTFDGRGHTIKVARTSVLAAGETDKFGNRGIFRSLLLGGVVRNLSVVSDTTVIYESLSGGIARDSKGLISNCFMNIQMAAPFGGENYLGGVVCYNHEARPGAGGGGRIEYAVVVSTINGLGTNAETEWLANYAPNGGIAVGAATQETGLTLGSFGPCFWDHEKANLFISGDLFDASAAGNAAELKAAYQSGEKLFVTSGVGSGAYDGADNFPHMKKSTTQMQTASGFAGFDTNIWNISDGGYPNLKVLP